MKLGQQTALHFLSESSTAVIGTVATIYVARELGSGAVGVYFLALAFVSWVRFPVVFGMTTAMTKRISEGKEEGAYALVGVGLVSLAAPIAVVALYLFSGHVTDYIGISSITLVVAMLLADVYVPVVQSILNGRHLVHVSGLLSTVGTLVRSATQVGAVAVGLGVSGLIGGYAVGWTVAILVGTVVALRLEWSIPTVSLQHVKELLSYAKYSWLGNLRGQVLNWVDILVLGFFVGPSLVGIYGVVWNLTRFLMMFGDSISTALFPKISQSSADVTSSGDGETLISQSLSYAGLFLIPGLFGGVLLGEPLLRIYGTEFARGNVVLGILLCGAVLHGYQTQLLNGLNAVDRPQLAFHTNAVLITTNVVLNVVLVAGFGWVGAAVATSLSSGFALVVAYRYLGNVISVSVPLSDIAHQLFSAVVMAVVVFLGRVSLVPLAPAYEFAIVLGLVAVGVGVYFSVLLTVSEQFRQTVERNLGIDLSTFLLRR